MILCMCTGSRASARSGASCTVHVHNNLITQSDYRENSQETNDRAVTEKGR